MNSWFFSALTSFSRLTLAVSFVHFTPRDADECYICVVIHISTKSVADPCPLSVFFISSCIGDIQAVVYFFICIFWYWRGCLALHLILSLANVSLIFVVGISFKTILFILIK